MSKPKPEARLYYDGQCPLCCYEMRHLRELKSPELSLVDLHQEPELDARQRERMLRRLHLQRADGRWFLGVEASLAAWSYTSWGWLLKPLQWPILAPVADRLYTLWAERRYRKRYGCGQCADDTQSEP